MSKDNKDRQHFCIDSIQETLPAPCHYDALGRVRVFRAVRDGVEERTRDEQLNALYGASAINDTLRGSLSEQQRFEMADNGSEEQAGANPLSLIAMDGLLAAQRIALDEAIRIAETSPVRTPPT